MRAADAERAEAASEITIATLHKEAVFLVQREERRSSMDAEKDNFVRFLAVLSVFPPLCPVSCVCLRFLSLKFAADVLECFVVFFIKSCASCCYFVASSRVVLLTRHLHPESWG